MLGLVLLAAIPAFAGTSSAQAEDRKCIRDMMVLLQDMKAAKRQCDPKNFVSRDDEYGWACDVMSRGPERVKGRGAKKPEDALCE